MRMFLLCFLLFLPLTAKAACSEHNSDPDDCINTAGCYYSNNVGCSNCPSNSNANSIGYYCPQNGICANGTPSDHGRCSCPDGYPLSAEGAQNNDSCYKNIDCHDESDNTEQCKQSPRGNINCQNINGAHIENINGDSKCYAGTRLCSLFGAVNCTSEQISGTATRTSMHGDNVWSISSCSCGSTDFVNNDMLFCHGKQNGTSPSFATVPDVGSTITYDNYTNNYSYYCTRCILDNGNTKYYANTTWSNGQCSPGNGRVCRCETSNDLGYWRDGGCNSTTDWTDDNICKRVPCPAGKTTSEILPTGILGCHYTNQTKFCDANGCFNITNVPADWNWQNIP